MADAPPESRFAFSRHGLARLGRLVRKELAEILRDRRTILTLIGMPLLLYPLMTVAFQQYFLAIRPVLEYRIGCSNANKDLIARIIADGEEPTKKPPLLTIEGLSDPDEMVRKNAIDVFLHLLNVDDKSGILQARAVYLPSSTSAHMALALFEHRLAVRNQRELEKRLGADRSFKIVKLKLEPLPQTEAGGPISLAALVPLILILMTITGAVYPAIDLTAGERERGTLEILVAAPVPRLGLLFAKYVAVVTVAILTALVNLIAMIAVLTWSGLGQHLFGTIPLPWFLAILVILGLLILFAVFFSAVLLILTSFARSFKEAQAYLIPLMLASLGPGLIGIIPGMKLTRILAVTPLVNIVLLARDIFEKSGGAELLDIFLVTTSTLLYALIALSLAARIFGAEEVLYNEQTSWSDLWRRPRHRQTTASVGGALLCLALMVPINFLLQAAIRLVSPVELLVHPTMLIAAMSLVNIALFILYPSLAAYLGKVNFRTGFSLVKVPWLTLVGGAILGVSLWPFVAQLMAFFHTDPAAFDQPQITELLQTMKNLGLGMTIFLGVSAIAEEFFFRGYLFSALSRGSKPLTVIVLSAILFGLMHCLTLGLFERLLPATLLGLVLGTMRWYTKSVYPGMVLHLVHNLLMAIVLQDADLSAANSVPAIWLMIGAAGVPLGAGLVYWDRLRFSARS